MNNSMIPICSNVDESFRGFCVFVCSVCALGDLFPLFFRLDRLTFVGPTVRPGKRTPRGTRDTQPNF